MFSCCDVDDDVVVDEADILDGSPCMGCVSIGTGGGMGNGRGVVMSMSTALMGLEGVDNVPESVPNPSLLSPSPSKLLRSSKAVDAPCLSFASLILDLPETSNAVFRREPLRFLVPFCGVVVDMAVPAWGLGGGSPIAPAEGVDFVPWSLLELDRENMNDEMLPERLLRGLVAVPWLAFLSFPCFAASCSGSLTSAPASAALE